jgi:hypothetical protein
MFLKFDDLFHGITYKEPYNEPNGCNIKTIGINVSVIILFHIVHSFLGLVAHNKSSSNCIPHHPTNIRAIH